jgi:hypothetical protein
MTFLEREKYEEEADRETIRDELILIRRAVEIAAANTKCWYDTRVLYRPVSALLLTLILWRVW